MQIFAPGPHIPPAAEIRRQEGLAIDHAAGRRFLQHRKRQAVIILGRLQGRGRGLIDLQEIPEIPIAVVPARIEDACYVQMLFLRQPRDEGGRRRAFQMQMQFDFRQSAHTPLHFLSRNIPRGSGGVNPRRPVTGNSAPAPVPPPPDVPQR